MCWEEVGTYYVKANTLTPGASTSLDNYKINGLTDGIITIEKRILICDWTSWEDVEWDNKDHFQILPNVTIMKCKDDESVTFLPAQEGFGLVRKVYDSTQEQEVSEAKEVGDYHCIVSWETPDTGMNYTFDETGDKVCKINKRSFDHIDRYSLGSDESIHGSFNVLI